VLAAIDRLLPRWPTRDVVETSWGRYGWVAVVETHDAAIELADGEAMEHVEVQVARDEQDRYLHGLRNFGSLFLGEEATVVFGDKAVGTNHTLPTLGAARYTGGLWVGKFLKTLTYQRLTADGARATAPTAAAISDAEGFAGHAISARLRMTPATA
jgi:sulfopropanediol 3-dehydrogenase